MTADPVTADPMIADPTGNGAFPQSSAARPFRPRAPAVSRPGFLLCFSFGAVLLCPTAHATDVPAALQPAQRALLEGRADEAANLLQKAISADPGNGVAHLLLCRVLLSEDFAKDAAIECQRALSDGLARDSDAQIWTGRALGGQAMGAPAFRVHTQLGTLLAKSGHRDAARVEYIAALNLASGYTPARKGLATL